MNTVDLSEKLKTQNEASKKSQGSVAAKNGATKFLPRPEKKIVSKASEIDKIYNGREDELPDNDFQKISRPKLDRLGVKFYKGAAWALMVVVIFCFSYFFISRNEKSANQQQTSQSTSGWYSVKLTNGEVYYGQIGDLSADPIVISNVYYNYDQLNPAVAGEDKKENANLRLVKRGKEVHGPDGTLSVVRAQVVYMEPMKEDSKVLKAILEYEK